MQGDREFHRAEPGRQVPAHRADRVDQELTQFRGKRREVVLDQRTQVGGGLNRVQDPGRFLLGHGVSVLEALRAA